MRCWLVNARHVRHLPGRAKTDRLDAVWLAKVAERGMCSPSHVPARPLRRLRLLTRYRGTRVQERSREMSRVEKLLEDTQTKLSVVASDIFGVSGRAMLDALVAGQRDPTVLAELARSRMRPKKAELARAFQGSFEDHHGLLLGMMLAHVDRLTADITALDGQITAALTEIENASGPQAADPGSGEIPPGAPTAGGDSQPEVNAVAENLPFDDGSVDAAMAMLTVHQWSDPDRGLRELRRVSRGPQVAQKPGESLARSGWRRARAGSPLREGGLEGGAHTGDLEAFLAGGEVQPSDPHITVGLYVENVGPASPGAASDPDAGGGRGVAPTLPVDVPARAR